MDWREIEGSNQRVGIPLIKAGASWTMLCPKRLTVEKRDDALKQGESLLC